VYALFGSIPLCCRYVPLECHSKGQGHKWSYAVFSLISSTQANEDCPWRGPTWGIPVSSYWRPMRVMLLVYILAPNVGHSRVYSVKLNAPKWEAATPLTAAHLRGKNQAKALPVYEKCLLHSGWVTCCSRHAAQMSWLMRQGARKAKNSDKSRAKNVAVTGMSWFYGWFGRWQVHSPHISWQMRCAHYSYGP